MTEKTNERYIQIEGTNIVVGFNFIKQKYYITNRDKTVYSSNAEDIYNTLTTVFNITTVSEADIVQCNTDTETLHDIYYTWQDNGAYIHTLQFNEFPDYALTIDCEKQKLYIMNSNVIFDLSTDESKQARLPYICSFYKNTLGLSIPQKDMDMLYELLLSYYTPTCYNQIALEETTNTPKYSNKFLCSNYNGEAVAVYNCTRNPNNTTEPIQVGSIESLDTNTNTIYLASPIEDSRLVEGSNIAIEGASIVIAETPYSADGTYTIQGILENSTHNIVGIVTNETLPINYEFPYIKCYVKATECTVESMDSEANTITVTGDVSNLLIGDTVVVRNAVISSTHEVTDLSGEYTIQSIEKHGDEYNIQVLEQVQTSYTWQSNNPSLIKGVLIGDVVSITDTTITLTNLLYKEADVTVLSTLVADTDVIYMSNSSTEYTVGSTGSNTITTEATGILYNAQYPKLQYLNPSEEILINVTSVDESIEDMFPRGEFIVDNFEQAVAYLGSVAHLVVPNEDIKNNMYGDIPSSMTIQLSEDKTIEGKYVGLYSERYSEG